MKVRNTTSRSRQTETRRVVGLTLPFYRDKVTYKRGSPDCRDREESTVYGTSRSSYLRTDVRHRGRGGDSGGYRHPVGRGSCVE